MQQSITKQLRIPLLIDIKTTNQPNSESINDMNVNQKLKHPRTIITVSLYVPDAVSRQSVKTSTLIVGTTLNSQLVSSYFEV